MTDFQTSIVRTLVPMIAGTLIVWATKLRLPLDGDVATQLATAAAGAVYYLAVRLLEQARPRLGWLLGAARIPVYEAGTTRALQVVGEVSADAQSVLLRTVDGKVIGSARLPFDPPVAWEPSAPARPSLDQETDG